MSNYDQAMAWINKLPEVGDPILKMRENVRKMMIDADELTRLAEKKRSDAYVMALNIESQLRKSWTVEEIEQAKSLAP